MIVQYPIKVIVLVGLIAVGATFFYLFRVRVVDIPAVGRATLGYRWGKAHELSIDVNRDGRIDARYLIAGRFGQYSPHDPAIESWESSRCDGTFDIHIVHAESGKLERIERDLDRNGKYEIMLYDEDAVEFRRLHPKPHCSAEQSGINCLKNIQPARTGKPASACFGEIFTGPLRLVSGKYWKSTIPFPDC
ncbi:MAG: hypothetical protein GY849_14020 [Deltaproteobacteria bacterium]|nr:hypothetical protein [Deltaproteobacteria bacterium]